MRLTRRQLLAGATAGVLGAGGAYALVDELTGSGPARPRRGALRPEQHLLDGVQVVDSNGVEVLVPPLHDRILTAEVAVDRADLPDAHRQLERTLAGLENDYAPTPAGLGVTVAWGLPYFRRLVPEQAKRMLPFDRRALKPVLFDSPRFPSDPEDTVLEQNEVAILLRSDVRAHTDDARKRILDTKLFRLTSERVGFAGGGFEGGRSLPKRMAEAAGVPGADLVPDTSELFLGFTSTQKAGIGPGRIANLETLGYVDFGGHDYFVHGTHMHLSHIREDLEAWYLNFDFDERAAGDADGAAGAARRVGRRQGSARLPGRRAHRSQRVDPDDVAARQGRRRARRHRLPEGRRDPDPRRLQHARQPVPLVGAARRGAAGRGGRRPLRRLQPDRRRLPPKPARDGRRAAGRQDPVPAPRPKPGLQLGALDDAPPELPRPAAAAPRLPARRALRVGNCFVDMSTKQFRGLAEEGAPDLVPVVGHGLQLRSRLLERDVDDVVALERRHAPELALRDAVVGLQPEARRANAVARRRGAAALDVPEHRDAGLEAGRPLDLLAQPLADAALRQQTMTELIHLALVLRPGQVAALADDDDREVLSACVPAPDLAADLLDVDRPFRDEDHVRAAGDAAHHGDPAGVAAHHLHHHDAVVRLGGRVQPVDRLRADRDGGVEAERVVGAGEVVVDRLRHPDDRDLVLAVQPGSHAERVLAADRHQGVELPERGQHAVHAAVHLVRVRARRADDRAAAREDPRDLLRPERLEELLDHPAPALAHADDVVAARPRPARDGTDDRVQPGAVAAAGEDPDAHVASLEIAPARSAEEQADRVLGQQVAHAVGLRNRLRRARPQRHDHEHARPPPERTHLRPRLDRHVAAEAVADGERAPDQLELLVAPLRQQPAPQLPVDGPAVVRVDERETLELVALVEVGNARHRELQQRRPEPDRSRELRDPRGERLELPA